MRVLTTFLCILWLPLAALAQPAGHDAPAFEMALDHWLEGDDLVALNSLAQLSRDGNTAAQIMLARIGGFANLHAHVTADLPRKERIALMRQPKGLSGKSWLLAAKESDLLAQAFWDAKSSDARDQAIVPLLDAGEVTAGLDAAFNAAIRGVAMPAWEALVPRLDSLPAEARKLALIAGTIANELDLPDAPSRAAFAILRAGMTVGAEYAWSYVSPQDVLQEGAKFATLVSVAPDVDAWAPIRAFCTGHCAATRDACTVVGVSLSARLGYLPLASPVETLLPAEAYQNSSRIEGDFVRGIEDIRLRKDQFDNRDACFMDAVAPLQRVHGFAP